MSAGDWIAIVGLCVTVFLAFAAWMAATFMRVGKILEEVRHIGGQVKTLTSAFDSQEKLVVALDKRVAVIESHEHPQPGRMANAH